MNTTNIKHQTINILNLRDIYLQIVEYERNAKYDQSIIIKDDGMFDSPKNTTGKKRKKRPDYELKIPFKSVTERITNSINFIRAVYFRKTEYVKYNRDKVSSYTLCHALNICILDDDFDLFYIVLNSEPMYREANGIYLSYNLAIKNKGVPSIEILKWLVDSQHTINENIPKYIKICIDEGNKTIFDIIFDKLMNRLYNYKKNKLIEIINLRCLSSQDPHFINKFSNHEMLTIDSLSNIIIKMIFNFQTDKMISVYKTAIFKSKYNPELVIEKIVSKVISEKEPKQSIIEVCKSLIFHMYWEKVGKFLCLWKMVENDDVAIRLSNIVTSKYEMYNRLCDQQVINKDVIS